MERDRVACLLEKYWQGETSLEEENELKQFFNDPAHTDEWPEEADYFKYLEVQQKKTSAPADEEILSIISGIQPEHSRKGKQVKLWAGNISKAAAVILIVSVAAFFVREDYMSKKDQMDPVISDTFEDPQKAFEETKKALMLVSRQFGKGRKHAQKLTAFDDATEKVQEL